MFQPLRKYAIARGRASRGEFWYFYLFFFVTIMILAIIEEIFGLSPESEDGGILVTIFYVSVLLPIICLSIRRLHDLDHSGWYILLNFIPIINIILFIYLGFWKGTEGNNQYGPDPLNEIEVPDAKVFE